VDFQGRSGLGLDGGIVTGFFESLGGQLAAGITVNTGGIYEEFPFGVIWNPFLPIRHGFSSFYHISPSQDGIESELK
jgi:hypothetical protein